MIRITVELIPFGLLSPVHLGTADIINDGTGTRSIGNYTVRLSRKGQPGSTWKTAVVRGFPRLRLGAWDILYLALHAVVGKRNQKYIPEEVCLAESES